MFHVKHSMQSIVYKIALNINNALNFIFVLIKKTLVKAYFKQNTKNFSKSKTLSLFIQYKKCFTWNIFTIIKQPFPHTFQNLLNCISWLSQKTLTYQKRLFFTHFFHEGIFVQNSKNRFERVLEKFWGCKIETAYFQ